MLIFSRVYVACISGHIFIKVNFFKKYKNVKCFKFFILFELCRECGIRRYNIDILRFNDGITILETGYDMGVNAAYKIYSINFRRPQLFWISDNFFKIRFYYNISVSQSISWHTLKLRLEIQEK